MPAKPKPAVAPVVEEASPVVPPVEEVAVEEPPAVPASEVVEFMPPLVDDEPPAVDEPVVADETAEPEAPVEDAPVPVPPPTLAEIVAAAERVGNEYHVRPALRVDAAVERDLEKLGYGHERSGAHVTVLYRK